MTSISINKSIGYKTIFFMFMIVSSIFFAQNIQTVDAQSTPIRVDDNLSGSSKDKPLITCGNSNPEECNLEQFIALVQSGLNLIFAVGAFIATGMFMYAGFLMITSSGNMSQISKAKTVFTRVIIGFLIMFVSFLLVQNLLKNLTLSETGRQVINQIINVE